jgi:hypothetical protein
VERVQGRPPARPFEFVAEPAGDEADERLLGLAEGAVWRPIHETDRAVQRSADRDAGPEITLDVVFLVGRVVSPALLGGVVERQHVLGLDGSPAERRREVHQFAGFDR